MNITNFGNCDDVADVKVSLTSVSYDYNADGLCDTIHGRYNVLSKDVGLNYEVSNTTRIDKLYNWMIIFYC